MTRPVSGMPECAVCGEKTDAPVRAALSHFRLYERGYWIFLRGNQKQFGWWSGLQGTLGLAFPFYNTLRHWKYRRARLVIPGFTDARGRPLPKGDNNGQ